MMIIITIIYKVTNVIAKLLLTFGTSSIIININNNIIEKRHEIRREKDGDGDGKLRQTNFADFIGDGDGKLRYMGSKLRRTVLIYFRTGRSIEVLLDM